MTLRQMSKNWCNLWFDLRYWIPYWYSLYVSNGLRCMVLDKWIYKKKGTEHQAFCPCKLSSLLVIQSMCLTGLQYTHVLWNVHVFLKGFSIIRKSVPRNPARLTYSAWYHFQHTIYFFSFNYCLRYHIMKSSKCIIKFIHNVSYDLQSSTGVLDFKFTEMWCQTQLLAIGFLIVYQFW